MKKAIIERIITFADEHTESDTNTILGVTNIKFEPYFVTITNTAGEIRIDDDLITSITITDETAEDYIV